MRRVLLGVHEGEVEVAQVERGGPDRLGRDLAGKTMRL